jgi:NAD(P)-dependent dehydrogenase (short-subunit alcohol dehydrogenase family)
VSFEGKTILITGAANGIGRAIALGAGAAGARVIAVDLNQSALDAFKQELPQAICVQADISKGEDVNRAIAAAEDRLDVLCNNAAALDWNMLIDETPDELWNRVIATNLTAPFMLCRRAIPLMIAQGEGSIINIGSIASIRGGRAGGAYTASKHGLIGLTLNIAATFAAQGVRCNAVCPGGTTRHGTTVMHEPGQPFVDTAESRRKKGVYGGAVQSERGNRVIIGRDRDKLPPGKPEGIASIVLFLADSAVSWRVNGAVITGDEGATAF